MSDQLCYTWSTVGYGSTSGQRIRAVSPGLSAVQSEPVRALMKYLPYNLPQGTDPYAISLEEAPRSLAFLKNSRENILIHKKYVGADGVGRQGAFFTHLVTGPMMIAKTGAAVALSARGAIDLWGSTFWYTSENDLEAGKLTLPDVAPLNIQQQYGSLSPSLVTKSYTLGAHGTKTVQDYLQWVLCAFLMLPKLQKTQLFIAAPSEMVATFIWAITHCLPDTLTCMQNLTYSTYEQDVTKSPLTLVGTCWLPSAKQGGQLNHSQDLPALSYQPNGNALALNCYLDKYPRLQDDPLIENFVQFIAISLARNTMSQLNELVEDAEQQGIQEIDDFLELCRIELEPLTPERIKNILVKPQLMPRIKSSNVQEGLIQLLAADANWRTEGKQALRNMREGVDANLRSSLTEGLTAFSKRLVDEICASIQNPQDIDIPLFWSDILRQSLPDAALFDVGAHLVADLATLTSYSAVYQRWWDSYGKKALHELHQNADKRSGSALSHESNKLGQQAMQGLQVAMTTQSDESATGFWADVLATSVPITSQPRLYMQLLLNLWEVPPTPAYKKWWNEYSKKIAYDLRTIAENQPQWQQEIFEFTFQRAEAFCILAQRSDKGLYTKLEILLYLVPSTIEKNIWIFLLEHLTRLLPLDIPMYNNFHWNTRSTLLQKWSKIDISTHQDLLRRWLHVQWNELEKLVALNVSPAWQRIAITKCITSSISDAQEAARIAQNYPLFTEVLPQLMKAPSTQTAAEDFFYLLINNGYPYQYRVQLLGEMIASVAGQTEIVERLLSRAQLKGSMIASFLENHSQPLLQQNTLPPTLLSLLEQYLVTLNPATSEQVFTKAFLKRLIASLRLLPEQLGKQVLSSQNVSEFFSKPVISEDRLKSLSDSIHIMSSSGNDVRVALADRLVPILVKDISTEADLWQVIYFLGPVLMKPWANFPSPKLLLLERMAREAGEQYEQKRSRADLIVYIKVILGETYKATHSDINQIGKNEFVDGCFTSLLKNANISTGKWDIDWPVHLSKGWNEYLRRHRPAVQSESSPVLRPSSVTTPAPSHDSAKVLVQTPSSTSDPFASSQGEQKPILLSQSASLEPVLPASNSAPPSQKKSWLDNVGEFFAGKGDSLDEYRILLRAAFASKSVAEIASAYNPRFDKKIDYDSCAIGQLARDFITACDKQDDVAILEAYSKIRYSKFKVYLAFTPEQEGQVRLAESRVAEKNKGQPKRK